MFCGDIITVIAEFIGTINDLLSWRSTCKQMYNKIYKAYFVCDRFIEGIIPTRLDLSDTKMNYIIEHNISLVGNYIESLVSCSNLNNNHLKLVPNLKQLDCASSKLITDFGIRNVPNLTHLSCGYADITDEALECVPNLEYLDCGYDSYFSSVSNLPKLKTLKCGYSEVNSVSNVPKLEYLECGNSEDTTGIEYLTTMVYLDCGHNDEITSEEISKLVNLKYLYCSYSQNILDEAFVSLRNLQVLHCGESHELTNLTLKYLPQLINLHCGWNMNFTNDGLYYVPNLVTLYCGSNPNINDLHMLPNLKYLDCGSNSSIRDETFKTCTTLTHLDCWTHPILSDLTLHYLPNLVFLSHRYNFTEDAIRQLKKLKHLSCRNSTGMPYTFKSLHVECSNCMCTFECS